MGVACAFRPRAAVRLQNRAAALTLVLAHKMSHVYEYRRHQLRRDFLLLIFVRREVSARIFGWQYLCA